MFDMSFGDAVEMMKNGHRVTRLAWNTEWIWIQEPDAVDMEPYIEMCKDGVHTPYVPSHDDILSEDWEVVD